MSESTQGKQCGWRADGINQSICGKPVAGKGIMAVEWPGRAFLDPLDLCQKHLDEQRGFATAVGRG
jgi:hypothetical protein